MQVTSVEKANMLFDFIEPLVKDVAGIDEDMDDEVRPPPHPSRSLEPQLVFARDIDTGSSPVLFRTSSELA